MNKENASYDLRDVTKSLFNDPRMSDIRFLVDGQIVYGHKVILGMCSPVFQSMFFGQLKETREVIEIRYLSSTGFKNALRYIYGFQVDFEHADLYESYMVADMYLLHNFSEAFFEYIKERLNAKNCCLIYDQLIKIGEREEISLSHVRKMIVQNSKEVIESEHFTQIDRETLISLLSMELNSAEDDLLAATSKWINATLQRQGLPLDVGNRKRIFEPIKGYIRFTALTLKSFINKEISELFTLEETGSLLLQLLKQNPLKTEIKASREPDGVLGFYILLLSFIVFIILIFQRTNV